MASAVIHLAVANEINKELNRDKSQLLIGAIAPDISKFIGEEKTKSHFLKELDSNIPDIESFLNKYKNSSKKAIIYSAMVFGLVHLNIPQGINAFIGGIILGFIYCYTKSMKLSIFAHFINNLITFVPVPESLIFKFIYIMIGTYVIMKGIKYIRNTKLINISKAS